MAPAAPTPHSAQPRVPEKPLNPALQPAREPSPDRAQELAQAQLQLPAASSEPQEPELQLALARAQSLQAARLERVQPPGRQWRVQLQPPAAGQELQPEALPSGRVQMRAQLPPAAQPALEPCAPRLARARQQAPARQEHLPPRAV